MSYLVVCNTRRDCRSIPDWQHHYKIFTKDPWLRLLARQCLFLPPLYTSDFIIIAIMDSIFLFGTNWIKLNPGIVVYCRRCVRVRNWEKTRFPPCLCQSLSASKGAHLHSTPVHLPISPLTAAFDVDWQSRWDKVHMKWLWSLSLPSLSCRLTLLHFNLIYFHPTHSDVPTMSLYEEAFKKIKFANRQAAYIAWGGLGWRLRQVQRKVLM